MHVLVFLFSDSFFVLLKKLTFFVSLYKELLEPTFLVLDNLREVCRCLVITDFISTMFGFSNVFG